MGKVALITGSRRGIGLAAAKALAGEGYLAILSDVVPAGEAQPVVNELTAQGLKAEYIKLDISNSEDRKSAIDAIVLKHGRLDLLVNNAGVAPAVRMDILETTEQSYDRVMGINLRGTFFMCQAAANAMLECMKKGIEGYQPRIVNISSMSAYTSSVARGEYCISKAGISMVTQLFADKLAEFGIPVFEVRPGIIMTDMTAVVKDKYDKLISEGITPIKRFGQPEDVANCVLAAASGLLDFSTGQILNADGGYHVRRMN